MSLRARILKTNNEILERSGVLPLVISTFGSFETS